jgi:hypothetical protein
VENALRAVQKLNSAWKPTSSETMSKLLNSLLSKFVEDSTVSISEKLDSEVESSSEESDSKASDASDTDSSDRKSSQDPTQFYLDLLYDRAKKCVNEESVTQAGKPLLEIFVRYIEHAIESTDAPEGLNNYLGELTDDKYLIEERRKEVIALQTRLFVSHDLHQAVRKSYQKKPTEQLKQLIILYNHSL